MKAVREEMIQADICRNEINKRMGRLKRVIAWGVENERRRVDLHAGAAHAPALFRHNAATWLRHDMKEIRIMYAVQTRIGHEAGEFE